MLYWKIEENYSFEYLGVVKQYIGFRSVDINVNP